NDRLVAPRCLYEGGPVETEALIALARQHSAAPADDEHQVTVAAGVASIDLSTDPALVADATEVRVFQGYSGWGPGQLDAEIAAGGWIVVDAAGGDLFTEHPEDLWRRVLARQRGRLAWLADAPDDLSLN